MFDKSTELTKRGLEAVKLAAMRPLFCVFGAKIEGNFWDNTLSISVGKGLRGRDLNHKHIEITIFFSKAEKTALKLLLHLHL